VNLQSGAASEAKRRLKVIDPAFRGWEWHYLYAKADASSAAIGANGAVTFVTFSPDQSRVWWITQYGVVHVADAHTRRPIPRLTRPIGPLSGASQPAYIVAISPDGSRLLSSAWKPLRGPRTLMGSDPRGFGIGVQHRPLSTDERNALSLTDAVSGTLSRRFLVPDTGVWIWPQSTVSIREHAPFQITSRAEIRDAKGAPIFTMSGGGEPVSATFSPDGSRLATWAWDNVLRVWDVAAAAPVAALEGHRDGISSAAFSPDGARIVSGSYDGTARIWTVDGTRTPTVLAHEGAVTAVAFRADGLRVATGSDKLVRVWDVTGHAVATLSGHTGRVTAVDFAPTGHDLASGSEDRTVRVWNTDTLVTRGILYGHTDAISSLAFSTDGRRIVSGSADGTLRFWEPEAGRSDGVLTMVGGQVWQVAVSGDSSHVAVALHDGAVRILNLSAPSSPIDCARTPFPNFFGHKNIALTPDGRRLVSSYPSSGLQVWDASNCRTLASWTSPDRYETRDLSMSPDGRRVATAQSNGSLEVWDVGTSRRMWQTNQASRIRAIEYSPDGTRIVTTAGRDVRVWNADRPTVLLTMTGHDEDVTDVAASKDGRWIASASSDRTVRLWNATTGQAVATLTGHDASVNAIAFSPDSTRLVSGGSDRALRLWDVASREPILVLQGHQGNVTAVAFTPDGSRIVSGSADGAVRVWDSRVLRDSDAKPRVETPSDLDQASWRVVKAAGLRADAYELALQRALLANDAAPWHLPFIQTLGAAYYRVKRYDASLSTMARAASLRYSGDDPAAYDIVFTAMAHHQLGHLDDARAALNRARDLVTVEKGTGASIRNDLQALFEEAAALIGQSRSPR